LQLKQRAKAFFEASIQPFTTITTALQNSGIDYAVCGCIIRPKALLPYFYEIPAAAELFHTGNRDTIKLLDQLFKLYPTANALRYVPSLPKMDAGATLKDAVDFLGLDNQPVYVYYLRYAPVLQLQLYRLLSANAGDLFNRQQGDVVIFPTDLSWLIAYALETEWYAGRYAETNS